MKLWISAALMALTLIGAQVSAGTFYKWQDSDGVTHYGTLPPPGVEAVAVDTARGPRTPVAKPVAEEQTAASESQQEFDQRLQETKRERKAEMAKACQQAKEARVSFEAKHRIRLKQDDGSYKMLSEAEKQAEISKLDQQIQDYCYPK